MISTRRLDLMPEIDTLKQRCQSLAMLDAILCPEWQFRYYSFNAHWAPGEMMASMRDGSGNEYFIHFSSAGAIIKGLDHESPMASNLDDDRPHWPGVLAHVPAEFSSFLNEPAFDLGRTSFCIWRRYGDQSWSRGEIVFPARNAFDRIPEREMTEANKIAKAEWEADPDGSAHLLYILDGDPHTYQLWAGEYYDEGNTGWAVPIELVRRVYHHQPLTGELVAGLNHGVTLADLASDIAEIGYPDTPTEAE